MPEEDQGYIMVNAQLPDAASLERTDAAMRKAEAILEKNEAIEGFNTISGYSLLTVGVLLEHGLLLRAAQAVGGAARPPRRTRREVVSALNKAFAQEIPEGQVLAFGPPAIPGLGTGAGFTMQLQDRSGGAPQYLAEQTQRFMEAARKRPEIGRIATLYRASVPQVFADIDRSKVLKSGVLLNDVNTTLGALLGSSYINDFNKFGRVYKVYLQAEPEFRKDPKQLGLFFVRNQTGGMVPLDTLITTGPASGPEFTNRFNLFRSAELTGVPAAGFSSAQALDALEATAKEVLPADMSFDWADLSYQERRAPGVAVVFALAVFLVFLVLAAQYRELGDAVQRPARHAVRGLRRVSRAVARAPVHGRELREQRVRADRPDHAHRPGGEERDSHRRVRQGGARAGQEPGRRGAVGGEAAAPPDPDDRLRLHPRRRPAADGVGRRRRSAQGDGHGGVLRHAHRDDPRRPADSDAVCGGRTSDRRHAAGAGARRAAPGGTLAAEHGQGSH